MVSEPLKFDFAFFSWNYDEIYNRIDNGFRVENKWRVFVIIWLKQQSMRTILVASQLILLTKILHIVWPLLLFCFTDDGFFRHFFSNKISFVLLGVFDCPHFFFSFLIILIFFVSLTSIFRYPIISNPLILLLFITEMSSFRASFCFFSLIISCCYTTEDFMINLLFLLN